MRYLRAFGAGIAARDPDRQTAEIQIRIALMNHFAALGTAKIIRVASSRWGKGLSPHSREFCNNAATQPTVVDFIAVSPEGSRPKLC